MEVGATVHNLRWIDPNATEAYPEAVEFDRWIIDKVQNWDFKSLEQYQQLAPYAHLAVPRPEHFVPLLIAMGSGDQRKKPVVLNQTYEFGTLSNLCIEF